tara:strand:+ start:15830 stop:16720 length:891 start_codon:yes stop_codon:yes gene_type:complete
MSYKAGFVGLIGLPNAGKSSLANMLVGEKFSIVCHKAQTTRKRVLGIVNQEGLQAILMDAPGVIGKSSGLNRFLQDEYKDVMQKADVLVACLNMDAKSMEDLLRIADMTAASGKAWMILMTKSDLKPHRQLILRQKLQDYAVPILSVSTKQEVDKHKELILQEFAKLLPQSEAPIYEEDLFTLQSTKDWVAEIIREKCFYNIHEEIPYGLAVQVRKYEELEKIDRIFADIVIEKESYKSIVLGKRGELIKRIGTEARKEIELQLDKKVFLDLHVRIKEKWTKNPQAIRELGYVVEA